MPLQESQIAGVGQDGVKKMDERFNGNTVACLEVISSGISRAVMHIETNVMAQMVREKDAHCLHRFSV